MNKTITAVLLGAAAFSLSRWYGHETVAEGTANVSLQSEHAHFHFHVDMPQGMEVEAGDTVEVIDVPEIPASETHGELTYTSPVRLYKASWLRRQLIERTSLIEVKEIVDHP